jgi:uncharacterized protein YggU (UPF0235/DUF167 family)
VVSVVWGVVSFVWGVGSVAWVVVSFVWGVGSAVCGVGSVSRGIVSAVRGVGSVAWVVVSVSGYRFAVRVKPGARRTAVGGRWDGRLGVALVVAVTAPAVDGRANEAVCRALAAALGVPRAQVDVVVGAHARDKLVAVDPAPPDLGAKVNALTCDVTVEPRQ